MKPVKLFWLGMGIAVEMMKIEKLYTPRIDKGFVIHE